MRTLAPGLFVLLWSTGFVVAVLSAGHVEPFTFLAIRFPLAALVMALIAAVQGMAWPRGGDKVHAAVAGILLHGSYLAPVYWAAAHGLPGGVAALIVGLQPLLTAFIAAVMLKEIVTPRHWLGLAVGVTGVGLVVLPKLTAGLTGGITPVTVAAGLLGCAGAAWGSVYQKKYAAHVPLTTGGFWQYVGASLLTGLLSLWFEDQGFDGSWQAWTALGWSVIVLSTGAILLLLMLIRDGAVSRVSSLIYLVPAVTALMTYVAFGERLLPIQILGMGLCAAAVMLVNRRTS